MTMFEAAEPVVFTWCVRNCGAEAGLLVDHSQLVRRETLRRGNWGKSEVRGRIVAFKGWGRLRGANRAD
jgi:phosphosulfolactate synthase (CoM biosynthesis protein A)